MIDWIAEVTMDDAEGSKRRGLVSAGESEWLVHHFRTGFEWLDVPALIGQADTASKML